MLLELYRLSVDLYRIRWVEANDWAGDKNLGGPGALKAYQTVTGFVPSESVVGTPLPHLTIRQKHDVSAEEPCSAIFCSS